jgi:hypothetical protein
MWIFLELAWRVEQLGSEVLTVMLDDMVLMGWSAVGSCVVSCRGLCLRAECEVVV